MTLRNSDLQSVRDLDSIRNSCDVLNKNLSFLSKYHETECGMLNPAIRLEPNVPDFQFCLAMCAGRKVFTFKCNQNTGRLFWRNLVLLFCYDLFDSTIKNTPNFYKYWDISAVYALCRNPGRHLRHMESPWSHLHVCYEQSFTTCCSLEAGLRENVEWKRKWRENGERMRKWKGNWERNTKAKQFLPHFFCLKVAEIFVCRCYSSGERLCRRQAVQFGFSQDDIDQCKLDKWGYWKAFVQWKYPSRTKLRYFLQVLLSLANWQRATHRIGNALVQTPLPGSQFFLVMKAFEPKGWPR